MKKYLMIVLFSIIIGSIFALYVFKEYNARNNINLNNNSEQTIYLLQVGAYKNLDNANKITKTLPNYYVEKEDDLYHIYIGIIKNKENLKKIKEFYKVFEYKIYVRDKKIKNDDFIKTLESYEQVLMNTNKKEVVYTVNKEILNKYVSEVLK